MRAKCDSRSMKRASCLHNICHLLQKNTEPLTFQCTFCCWSLNEWLLMHLLFTFLSNFITYCVENSAIYFIIAVSPCSQSRWAELTEYEAAASYLAYELQRESIFLSSSWCLKKGWLLRFGDQLFPHPKMLMRRIFAHFSNRTCFEKITCFYMSVNYVWLRLLGKLTLGELYLNHISLLHVLFFWIMFISKIFCLVMPFPVQSSH